MATLYEILGVPPTASQNEIQEAYRFLATKFHPDKSPGKEPTAAEFFRRVQEAYEVLRDPTKRGHYDRRKPQPNGDGQASPGWKPVKSGVDLGGVQLNSDGTWILFDVEREAVPDGGHIVIPIGTKTHRFRYTNGRWYHRSENAPSGENGSSATAPPKSASPDRSATHGASTTVPRDVPGAVSRQGDEHNATYPRWMLHVGLALGAVLLIALGLWTQRDNLSAVGTANENPQRAEIQQAILELDETKKQDTALLQLIDDIRKDADKVFRRRQDKNPGDTIARQWFEIRDYTGVDGFARNAHVQFLNDALKSKNKVDPTKIKQAKDWALEQQRIIGQHQKFLDTHKVQVTDEIQNEVARLNREDDEKRQRIEQEEADRKKREEDDQRRMREQQRQLSEKQKLLDRKARLSELSDLAARTLLRIEDFENEVDTWKDKIETLFGNQEGAFLGNKEKYIDTFLGIYNEGERPNKEKGQLIRERVRELAKPVRDALAADESTYDPAPELKNLLRVELDKIESMIAAYRVPRLQIEGLVEQAKKEAASSNPTLTLQAAIAKRKSDDIEKHEALVKKAKSSDVTRVLGPLFAQGYWQPGDGQPKSLELHPVSYSKLEGFGALQPTNDGLYQLALVLSDSNDSKRPRRFGNARIPRQLPPQIREECLKIQNYLKELGPTLIELGKLDP